MDNEKLIEIVREYNYLYDLEDKKYSDPKKKDKAWEEIGIKLKANGKECKKTWALLRDAFRRANKKKRVSKSGPAGVAGKKWKYEDEMSYLLPHMKERPTMSTVTIAPDCHNDDNGKEDENTAQSPEDGHQTIGSDTFLFSTGLDVTQQTAATLPITSSQDTNSDKKPRPKQTDDTPCTVLMKYIMNSKINTQPPDDIQQFMTGITTTLRSFSSRDKAIAKAKIFKIVSEMEIEILSRPSMNFSEKTPMPDTIQEFHDKSS